LMVSLASCVATTVLEVLRLFMECRRNGPVVQGSAVGPGRLPVDAVAAGLCGGRSC
jgi:hypothetical protein